ncbi:hypothetical protein JW721_05775 [Candidatus Micrarchaeota archaeon]|nr:hypothetical protein [Candidatus Micrarchaeota archaeon]
MEIPKEDQENARKLGEAFRVVTELSEAGNKHALLSLALDKPHVDGAKSVLARLLDKFHHKFSDIDCSEDKRKLITDALDSNYSVTRFDLLKPYFYAGYFEVKK